MNSVPNTLIDQRQSLNSRPRLEKTTPKGHGLAKVEGGFPHSEIHGSMPVRGSPWLIAAYHVLHRLSAPRHPPDTLKTLDRSHYRCPAPEPRGVRRRRIDAWPPPKMRGSHKDLCFLPNLSGTGGGQASHHQPRARLAAVGVESTRRLGPRARLRLSRVPSLTAGHIHSSRCLRTRLEAWTGEAMRQPDGPVANGAICGR